jgi:carbamoyl-phosphate synthase large subunit
MDEMGKIQGAGAGRRDIRLLFTCAGRRIELITAFVRAARALRLRPEIHVADTESQFAAACVANRAHLVPPAKSADYIPSLLGIARKHRIDLLVPLVDVELVKLARTREEFIGQSCVPLISSLRVVQTCRDKLLTFRFLTSQGIDTPATWTPAEVMRRRRHRFPYYLKPRKGSASQGNFVLRNQRDLEALVPRVPEAIIQEFVPGIEHTLDVYTGLDGKPRCVVPRERVEVRGGEVTKACTAKHPGIMQTGARVVEALRDCLGLITIQLILTPEGLIRVIEVNPRFGGGAPLAIRAGADFPKWLMMEWLGRRPRIRPDGFRDRLMMLRYHRSFFVDDTRSPKPSRSAGASAGPQL